MRAWLLGALGTLAIAACSSGGNRIVVIDCSDSGAPAAEAGIPEAAAPMLPPLTAPLLSQLRAGDNVELVGVTTGATPYAAYNVHVPSSLPDTWSLEVVPLTGGTPIVLASGLTGIDSAIVSGGAVAWFVHVDGGTFISDSVSFWTLANGVKTVKTASLVGTFAASDDGTTVAFGANAAADGTHMDLVVTPSAAPVVKSPALTGKFAVNLADFSSECQPHLVFGGQTVFATYCTGTSTFASVESLFTATVGAAGAQRLAKLDDPSDVIDSFAPSPAGDKVYVHTQNGRGLALFFDGDQTSRKDLGIIDVGYPTTDLSKLYAATAGALKQIDLDPGAATTPLGPTDVLVLLALGKDGKTILYAKSVGPVLDASDLYLFDIATKRSSVVTALPDAIAVGFSGDGANLVYLDKVQLADDTASGHRGTLTSVPVGGGTATPLQTGASQVTVAPDGSGLIVVTNESDPVQTLARQTLSWIDVGKPQPASKIATVIRTHQGVWSHKTYVFENIGTLPGIYAVEVP